MLEELGVGTLATTFPSDRDDALAGPPASFLIASTAAAALKTS